MGPTIGYGFVRVGHANRGYTLQLEVEVVSIGEVSALLLNNWLCSLLRFGD